MPFTREDKILIKNLFELKGYNAKYLVRERLECQHRIQVVAVATVTWSTVVSAVADDTAPH